MIGQMFSAASNPIRRMSSHEPCVDRRRSHERESYDISRLKFVIIFYNCVRASAFAFLEDSCNNDALHITDEALHQGSAQNLGLISYFF
jgi:hypothetical protein